MLYKVVARYKPPSENPSYIRGKVGNQAKKTIYANDGDFNKYSPDLIKRWSRHYNVFVYESLDGIEWRYKV